MHYSLTEFSKSFEDIVLELLVCSYSVLEYLRGFPRGLYRATSLKRNSSPP